ncbi:MAG: acyltransferase family protein [Nocardioides sp.]|uniref:acyltransferase family protein n=1 Tax=Nocardioides sp. TaxID=35761 RepID=UPI0032634ACD
MARHVQQRPEWYRPDIDGLRAVAVVLVVGYHAGWRGFGVGLVGVDIFFVISGFVIAALLLREYDARGTVSWSSFYARRIRRLLPAAALMVMATVGLSMLLAPAWTNPWSIPVAGVAALTSTANFYYWWLWRDGLTPGALGVAEPSPLTHTWTLAAEEQFYLLVPVVALATLWLARGLIARRRTTPRRALLAVTVVLGAASLVLTWQLTGELAPGESYLLPFRVFEFCFGIALAIVGRQVQSLVVRSVIGVVGVVALVIVLAAPYQSLGGYPGSMVLLPCVFAVAMILARPRLLATPPLVHLGVLSYGWYLWHVPAIELAAAWNLGPISGTTTTLLAIGSLVPAALSHRFLEKPIRERSARALPTLVLGLVGVLALCTAGAGTAAVASSRSVDFPRPPESCRLHPADTVPRTGARCEVTPFDPGRPSIVLRGDSQAWQLLPAVLDRAIAQDVNVVAWIYPDCPPLQLSDDRAWTFLIGYEQGSVDWKRWADCLVVNQIASLDITALADAGGVETIAAASWPTYRSSAEPRVLGMLDRGTRGLVAQAEEQPVTLVVPIPELSRDGTSCRSRMWRVTACDLDRAAADDFVSESAQWVRMVAGDDAPVLDLTPDLCDDKTCSATSYLDPTRLDAQRVEQLAPYFDDVIDRLAIIGPQ